MASSTSIGSSELDGVFNAVRQIAQERARKLKAIRSLLETGDTDSALDRMRELVGLPIDGGQRRI